MKGEHNNKTEKIKHRPASEKAGRKTPKRLSETYLRNAGEYYLNRFPASSAHFETVMTRKIDRSCREHPDQSRQEWIDVLQNVTIPYFQQAGFLNDELYATALYNSLKQRGLSAAAIRTRMIHKKIPGPKINDLVKDEETGIDDREAVIIFAKKKKLGKFRVNPIGDDTQKRRELGKFARAGFSYDVVQTVME